jgi:hypothetical protein
MNKPSIPYESWSFGGGTGFGAYGPEDDLLHPQHAKPGETLSETWLYMWYVPEANISCFAYVWVHPNLNVLSSGLTAFQGLKNHHLEAELFDYRAFLPASIVQEDGNGRDIRVPNGMRIHIEQPLEHIHLSYDDPARGNAVDVVMRAASPPIMRESRLHFDQVLHTQGRMRLRGREYRIDGYGLRDRSWGELRPEASYPIPPYGWMTGTFPASRISWHVCAHDSPSTQPDWAGRMSVDEERLFKDGWIYRDGKPIRLRSCVQSTVRDPHLQRPLSHRMQLVDLEGREYAIRGTVVASLPWSSWPNMRAHVALVRWEMNGEVGWGDSQESQSGDYIRAVSVNP